MLAASRKISNGRMTTSLQLHQRPPPEPGMVPPEEPHQDDGDNPSHDAIRHPQRRIRQNGQHISLQAIGSSVQRQTHKRAPGAVVEPRLDEGFG